MIDQHVYLVTYINGDSVIDYGVKERIIGAYATLSKAMKVRAAFGLYGSLIDNDEYTRLLKMKRKTWHLGYGSLNILKLTIDNP